MKFYIIDNHDSFVYNLSDYFQEEGHDIVVENIDNANLNQIATKNFDGIIISPGPGKPEDAYCSKEVLNLYAGKIPILGVCLGHQVIANFFGGNVIKGKKPMHGKISKLYHKKNNLFQGLPKYFNVTRYHSLVVQKESLPKDFIIDAVTDDGDIMAITNFGKKVYGVQFHPEALLTEYGHDIIRNFIKICKEQDYNNDKN